jgi:hypothetical protein
MAGEMPVTLDGHQAAGKAPAPVYGSAALG